jgi:hypothetical protein
MILKMLLYTLKMRNHIKTASVLANFLDNQFEIAGIRFGFSALIDLIPGVGDFLVAALSLYIVWIAWEVGVPSFVILQMIGNIVIFFFIGLIPVLGDALYILRQVNMKNLRLLQKYVPSSYIEEE